MCGVRVELPVTCEETKVELIRFMIEARGRGE